MISKRTTSIFLTIIFIISVFAGCTVTAPVTPQKTTTQQTTESESKEITVPDEVAKEAVNTKSDTAAGVDLATNEKINATPQDENKIVDEGAIETDGTVEQENISYDGTNSGKGDGERQFRFCQRIQLQKIWQCK